MDVIGARIAALAPRALALQQPANLRAAHGVGRDAAQSGQLGDGDGGAVDKRDDPPALAKATAATMMATTPRPDEMVATARAAGMRILGPNCLGVFDARRSYYATFSSSFDSGWPVLGWNNCPFHWPMLRLNLMSGQYSSSLPGFCPALMRFTSCTHSSRYRWRL